MMEIAVGGHCYFTGSGKRVLRLFAGSIRWVALLFLMMAIPVSSGPAFAQNAGSTMPSISDEPNDRAQVHYERAQLLESWEMWEKALEEYRRVLDITDFGPHRAGSRYGTAFCLFKLGKYQEALDALKHIEAEDMPDPSMQEAIERARQKILEAIREHSREVSDKP